MSDKQLKEEMKGLTQQIAPWREENKQSTGG
jgi:hypothetical protein